MLIVSFEVGWNLCYRSLYGVGECPSGKPRPEGTNDHSPSFQRWAEDLWRNSCILLLPAEPDI